MNVSVSRAAQFLKGTSSCATVPASYLAAPGTLTFFVYTPAPGGGVSAKAVNVAAPVSCPGKDLQTDPLNCGACDHDCLGTACTAGPL